MSRTHTKDISEQCKICGKLLSKKYYLKAHMMIHTVLKKLLTSAKHASSGPKVYSCSFCEYFTPYRSQMEDHERSHTGERPFICDVCGYRTGRKTQLKRHLLTHTDYKPHQCRLSPKNLLIAAKQACGGQKTVNCSFCEYSAPTRSEMKEHERSHTGERPFACDASLKYLPSAAKRASGGRKIETLTRTENMPHQCHLFFKNLPITAKRASSDQNTVSSSFCEYTAPTKSQIGEHERSHTSERPIFTCDLASPFLLLFRPICVVVVLHIQPVRLTNKHSVFPFFLLHMNARYVGEVLQEKITYKLI
ncbi:Zinc finger protein 596 like protein [Argiope bruennichi]|uniref:Zinc finger protein 596 like protein n=1 Tax=Argiope bruennichi TaxID=94029 RepID=A0A8T0FBR7_ARGBR|nr:Zinc finger protein 596 like protein [Argiope bruennichi]